MSVSVVKGKPIVYIKQRKNQCGVYALKAVLTLFDKDDRERASQYLTFIGRLSSGFTFPKRLVSVLRKKGLKASFLRANREDNPLEVLKTYIRNNEPVIILLGNNFTPSRKYQKLRRAVGFHWLVLLGFNDEKKCVYVYDPNVKPNKMQKDLPVGNISLSYDLFMGQWRGAWLTRLLSYSFIPVTK